MEPVFVEYHEASVSRPLRQGDVLESIDSGAPRWRRHLVVITADCDFANEKNQGRVTCVPLLTAEEYLLEMHVPKWIEALRRKVVDELQGAIATACGRSISPSRLVAWPGEVGVDAVIEALSLENQAASQVRPLVEQVNIFSRRTNSFEEAVTNLIDGQLAARVPKKRQSIVNDLRGKLKDVYSKPPGDALFLSALAPGLSDGYFAYLRHLEQPSQNSIALGPGQNGAEYRRISRLPERIAHALVQRFGMVFMSIGLPTEYEGLRELHLQVLGERFA